MSVASKESGRGTWAGHVSQSGNQRSHLYRQLLTVGARRLPLNRGRSVPHQLLTLAQVTERDGQARSELAERGAQRFDVGGSGVNLDSEAMEILTKPGEFLGRLPGVHHNDAQCLGILDHVLISADHPVGAGTPVQGDQVVVVRIVSDRGTVCRQVGVPVPRGLKEPANGPRLPRVK